MTYFLPEKTPDEVFRHNDPGVEPVGLLEGTVAAITRSMIGDGANFRYAKEKNDVRDGLLSEAIDIIGPEKVWAGLIEQGLAPNTPYDDRAANLMQNNLLWKPVIQKMARDAAEADPTAWANVDLSDENIEQMANARLEAEYKEADALVRAMPAKRGLASFIGAMAGSLADVRQAPLLFLGGSGSFMRVMGQEALINMTTEAALMPSRFEMAERLNIPDPNVGQDLLIAGVAGGLFGGAMEAAARSFRYIQARGEIPANAFPDLPPHERAGLIDRSEDRLASDSPNVFAETRADMERTYQRVGMEDRAFSPITEEDFNRVLADAPSEDPVEMHEFFVAETEKAIVESDGMMTYKYPLAETIKRRGGIQYKRENPLTGEKELTPAAQELAAMGVTPKTHPFIWRRNGMSDLDNLVASEFDRLGEVLPVDQATGYFEADALVRALGDELSSGNKTPMNADIAHMMDQVARSSPEDFRPRIGDRSEAYEPPETGLYGGEITRDYSFVDDLADRLAEAQDVPGGDYLFTADDVSRIASRYGDDPEKAMDRIKTLDRLLSEMARNRKENGWTREEYLSRRARLGREVMLLRHMHGLSDYPGNPVRKFGYEEGGPVFGKHVEKWERELISGIFEDFGFDKKVHFERAPKRLASDAAAQFQARPKLFRGYKMVITLPANGRKSVKNLESILHEVGHAMEVFLMEKTPGLRDKLYADWLNRINFSTEPVFMFWGSGGIGSRRSTLMKGYDPDSFYGLETASRNFSAVTANPVYEGALGAQYQKYAYSFEEYFAQQTVRFLEGDRAATSVIEKFFKRLADAWRRLTSRLRDTKYVDPSIKDLFEKARVHPYKPENPVSAPVRPREAGYTQAAGEPSGYFDDPLSAEASAAYDQIETDMRDFFGDQDNLSGMTPEQREFGELLLAEVGIYRDFSEALDLCGRMK